MLPKLVAVFIILGIFSTVSANDLRVGALGGFGSSGVTTQNNLTRSESPLGFGFFVDYTIDSNRTFGVEHFRSFSLDSMSSSISLTGIVGKWYFWNPVPQNILKFQESTSVLQKTITPYVGIGTGFDQSSILARNDSESDASAAGFYAVFKGGLEYPVWNRFGARGEVSFSTTLLGSGSIQTLQALAGIYAYF